MGEQNETPLNKVELSYGSLCQIAGMQFFIP